MCAEGGRIPGITYVTEVSYESNTRGGEIGGAGGASAPPLLKQRGLSPLIIILCNVKIMH